MEMPSPLWPAAVVAPPQPRCLCSAAPLCDARQLDDEAGLLGSAMEMPSPLRPAAVVAPPRPCCLCSAAPLCDARQLDDEAGLLGSAMEMSSPVGPRRLWHRRDRAASA
eukprot:scaffold95688_cov45-Phaeocystis_antarctica.AAC.1